MYENGSLSQVTGGHLHPGGMQLSERLLALCQPAPAELVLDVGCGEGRTLAYIRQEFSVKIIGVDRSRFLLKSGRQKGTVCAMGEALPLPAGQVDIVLSECSFSAIGSFENLLGESRRVLRSAGKLALSDIYARNPQGAADLRSLPFCSGLRNLLSQAELFVVLQKHGFEVLVWEDHSQVIKTLSGKIYGTHGAYSQFWSSAEPAVDPLDTVITLSRAKLGYYLLLAQKV